MEMITENIGTVFISVLVAGMLTIAALSMKKDRREGRACACGCDCGCCENCGCGCGQGDKRSESSPSCCDK